MHFQEQLRLLILKEKPELVIETGVQTGVSTEHILRALVENGLGFLFSIDPAKDKIDAVAKGLTAEQRDRWFPYVDLSVNALYNLGTTKPWDIFLHDSDHGVACQTYEYEMAWCCVRPGGLICSDDWTWSDHGAWTAFVQRHGLMSDTLGAMAWVRKPLDTLVATSTEERWAAHQRCLDLARIAAGGIAGKIIDAVAQDGVKSSY